MSPLLPQADLDLVLSLTPSFWSRYQGARLFITGGTGFIGNWLVQTVQRANDVLGSRIELIVLSRDPQRIQNSHPRVFSRPDIQLIGGDITSFTEPEGPLDLCIHAATDVAIAPQGQEALRLFDSIVTGTRRVLDIAQHKGVSRILLASSGAVYGIQPPDLLNIPENYAGAPSPQQLSAGYGHGKRAAEWLSCAYAAQSNLEIAIARIFALVGPGLPLNGPFAAGNFIRDALSQAPILIQGDGRPIRSYLYMADLCVWLFRLLESGQSGEAYNVGSESSLSILDLANQIAQMAGTSSPIEVLTPANAASLAARYVPDTSKARQSLQLREYTPLQSALLKSLEWNRLTPTV